MDKLYLDTNVILDYLQRRPGREYIESLLKLADKEAIILVTSVLNFATIFYLERKVGYSTSQIINRFSSLNRVILPVDQTVKSYESALQSGFSDFEDALQNFAAIESSCDYLITGNKKHFKKSVLQVLTSKEMIARLNK